MVHAMNCGTVQGMACNCTAGQKWTPGPWRSEHGVIMSGVMGVAIVTEVPYHRQEEFRGNIRLIESAPKMAEILTDLDGFRDAFIAREYEPNSPVVIDLFDKVRDMLKELRDFRS